MNERVRCIAARYSLAGSPPRGIATDLAITGPSTWDRFNSSAEDIRWYYESVADIATKREAKPFLRVNLADAIADMRADSTQIQGSTRHE